MTNPAGVTEKWYDKTGLVIFLLIIFFPVGLYALWKSSKISKGWKIAGTAIIVFLVIAVARSPKEKSAVADAPLATPASTPDVASASDAPSTASSEKSDPSPTEAYLFKTPEDFKEAFNKYCRSAGLDFNIDDIEVKEGEVQNSFQYMFTDHLGILGSINKADGSLKEITMIGSGDGTTKSGTNIMICMLSIIATVDPALEPSKRADVLKDLGILGDDVDMANLSGKTNRNGIHYYVSSSKLMGLMFGASHT